MRSLRLASFGLIVGLGSLVMSSNAKADVLYGISDPLGAGTTKLYTIDTSSGALNAGVTIKTDTDPANAVTGTTNVVGLGSLGGTSLFALNLNTATDGISFGSVNNMTGAFHVLSSGLSGNLSGITANATNSAFWVVDNGSGTLEQIDTAGAISNTNTITGAAGITFSALALNTTNALNLNSIYAIGSDNQLYAITQAGVATALGGLADPTNDPSGFTDGSDYGLAYQGSTLYLNAGSFDASLYVLDPTAPGSLTPQGGDGNFQIQGDNISGIAFSTPVPEPSTIALAGMAIPALGFLVLKRRKTLNVVPAPVA